MQDAAILKDPAFIPDISALWAAGAYAHDFITDFVEALGRARDLRAVFARVESLGIPIVGAI